ncbi:MAG: type 4a pilus biogenesis protein PilO [Candidatus Pacebacteria bacterium]|jgi:Tfp pilus assembly protein PilO|nr:type 4a pilus biogenesis protein PilO [Candidatus Paceibacterota bacterium]
MAKNKQEQLASVLMDFYQKPVARVSIELILSILIVIFFALFAIRPTLITMADLVKEIQDKKELTQQMNLKLASLASAQEQYTLYQPQFYLLEETIPRQLDLVKSLKKLEKLAGEGQLVINVMSLTKVPKTVEEGSLSNEFSNYQRDFLEINIEVIGSYLQIREFVEKIMNLRQVIIVDQVVVERMTESDNLSASLKVSLPYYILSSTMDQ